MPKGVCYSTRDACGLEVVDNPGRGLCLYHALAPSAGLLNGRSFQKEFAARAKVSGDDDLASRIKKAKKHWATDLELLAAVRLFPQELPDGVLMFETPADKIWWFTTDGADEMDGEAAQRLLVGSDHMCAVWFTPNHFVALRPCRTERCWRWCSGIRHLLFLRLQCLQVLLRRWVAVPVSREVLLSVDLELGDDDSPKS